jgi:hypothetical protein
VKIFHVVKENTPSGSRRSPTALSGEIELVPSFPLPLGLSLFIIPNHTATDSQIYAPVRQLIAPLSAANQHKAATCMDCKLN